ncbi:hypothetical protein J4E93_001251 [Alternaria ventricosa]|uniref:uncharacterized protein n=1 Tax=Alternaria ventricosa TaxID=1187951 RepID=UPI0020C38F62|nr:uncharacterized protein J4E93_001251 [Alternaria ventricosa]KAI4653485.1 hypothetical protein J4E93_001251 [Alternaria ventricosa]
MSSTGSISSEASIARSADKDDTSDSSLHLPDTEPTDDKEHVEGDESIADEAGRDEDASDKEQETSAAIDDAIASHNERTGLDEVSLEDSASSTTPQQLCLVADSILGSMFGVERAMLQLREYVKTENQDRKPIHQWARFEGYRGIDRAVANLDEAGAMFQDVHLPASFVKTYLSRATEMSLTVSKAAVFCMGAMNEQFTRYIEETSVSTDAEAKITEELRKLLKHGSKATYSVYAALDLLRNKLLIDESNQSRDIPIIEKLIAESEARLSASCESSWWTLAKVVLGAATSAVIALAAAHMYGTNGFSLALPADFNGTHYQVLSLVQRAQALTNLTGELYSIKIDDLAQHYKELELASESHGLRIDNLVEALGVPNEEGTYFSSMPKPGMGCTTRNDHSCVPEIMADANRQTEKLRSELEHMRKNMHRMDIRLMKRLDKVDKRSL